MVRSKNGQGDEGNGSEQPLSNQQNKNGQGDESNGNEQLNKTRMDKVMRAMVRSKNGQKQE
jgi:hypothetical protein